MNQTREKEPQDITMLLIEIFFVVLVLLIICYSIYFYTSPVSPIDDAPASFTNLTVVNTDTFENTDFLTVYDNTTGVEYIITVTKEKNKKTVSFITPLYCQDGSLKVYEGALKNN